MNKDTDKAKHRSNGWRVYAISKNALGKTSIFMYDRKRRNTRHIQDVS